MPGSGKSTIGKLLAEKLGWQFVDLDVLIKEKGIEKLFEERTKLYGNSAHFTIKCSGISPGEISNKLYEFAKTA